ncbi:hypothetical protein HFD88_008995 [Aspergillus terreus]|nr:hypothetical protein HFD88_008995 [Aspergillus terreus]
MGPSTAIECISIKEGDDLDIPSRNRLPFQHLGPLGTGGSAHVEMVRDRTTGRVFAHKLYRRFHGRDIARFKVQVQNEISIIRRLSKNPHIIQVFATYTCGREVGLILNPVADGGDLGNYLQTIQDTGQGPTAEQKAVLERSFGCLASGISFIHMQTIRHKDIKPQNILIHQGSVLYTDFGISLDASQDERTTTMGTALSLTLRYCAPEVARYVKRNRKSDIFSLGCVFVEILAVLEPEINLAGTEDVPYYAVVDKVRSMLSSLLDAGSERANLVLLCVEMLNPEPQDRIGAAGLLREIGSLGPKEDTKVDGGGQHRYYCKSCARTIGEHASRPVTDIATNDSQAWVNLSSIYEREPPDKPLFEIVESHLSAARSVALSPDRRLAASAFADATIWLRELATNELCGVLRGHSGIVNAVVFSPDGCLLASASDDRTVRVWNLTTNGQSFVLMGHRDWVQAVAFSADTKLMASASKDGTVRLWDLETMGLLAQLVGDTNPLRGVAFSQDCAQLASVTEYGRVVIWNIETKKEQGSFEGHLGWVNAVGFSPSGDLAVFACPDRAVRLKEVPSGALRGTFVGHSDWVRAVALSSDGKIMISSSIDGVVWVWDTATEALLAKFTGHSRLIHAVTLSADAKMIASASDDGTVRLWEPKAAAAQTEWVDLLAPVVRLL